MAQETPDRDHQSGIEIEPMKAADAAQLQSGSYLRSSPLSRTAPTMDSTEITVDSTQHTFDAAIPVGEAVRAATERMAGEWERPDQFSSPDRENLEHAHRVDGAGQLDSATYLQTEDGDYITTEDGERIILEDGRSENEATSVSAPPEQASSPEVAQSSSWTGRWSVSDRVRVVKELAPIALGEIDSLIHLVEDQRFNDPATVDALDHLKALHGALGELIAAAEAGQQDNRALALFETHREGLMTALKQGAKLCGVAPAMTLGVVHILAFLGGFPVDSGLMATVYAAMVGADVLPKLTSGSGNAKADR